MATINLLQDRISFYNALKPINYTALRYRYNGDGTYTLYAVDSNGDVMWDFYDHVGYHKVLEFVDKLTELVILGL